MSSTVYFQVKRKDVKTVKTALERQQKFLKFVGIQPSLDVEGAFLIPTTFPLSNTGEQLAGSLYCEIPKQWMKELGLEDLDVSIKIITQPNGSDSNSILTISPRGPKENAIHSAVALWLAEHKKSISPSLIPKTYSIYTPMVLLPPSAFSSSEWTSLFQTLLEERKADFFAYITNALHVTHLAINAPIPLTTSPSSQDEPNIIRAPTNIIPLHGDFGPHPSTLTTPPTQSDFTTAFWVQATQNGIHQIWAPLYTMFSRGNIREKTRLLSLPSVLSTVRLGPSSAVDLYAGIGYFAFSYAKAGVSKILCWDLNPWSVEGLRRGAERNGWGYVVLGTGETGRGEDVKAMADEETKFVVFNESNESELSLPRIRQLRPYIPPIRHVNLGILPTSRDSWTTAVHVLDSDLGGWAHVHENVADNPTSIAAAATECARAIGSKVKTLGGKGEEVRVEDVARVKTFAPGVVHVVFDVWVPPKHRGESLKVLDDKRNNTDK
ncbi:hypothetical protein M501DRAFT_1058075 [Patellaria atrata CBS 101060]|uniref:tRNA(Phe) (4-demethylwyosine(37)-C(7)) aminocarboxypropyltransferase n=1 Tax=Patellaria atrata CBS 101060 TaxID=1346257 RepID=A0A9P4VQX8_9PEZI|nr:hypothetical protein M501DRAFT_1058075 [Patellaria atrata CBS 101060]